MSVKEDPNDNTLGVKIATTGSAQGRSHNQGVKNKPIQNRNLPKYILKLRHPRQCTRSTSDTSGKPVGKPACCHYPEPLLTTLFHGVRLDTSLSLLGSSSSLWIASSAASSTSSTSSWLTRWQPAATMCGILALFGADPQANGELRAELLR